MGAGVSGWRLANAVSRRGQLGVVAGTGLDTLLARRLQEGDLGGHLRRALAALPIPGVAKRVLRRYFVPGGKPADSPYKATPVSSLRPQPNLLDLLIAGNFAEIFLAREGHDNPVGVNYLEKIQLPTLPSLYGAMLAGVSVVLMGAGIPLAIPGILDDFAAGAPAELRVTVQGAPAGVAHTTRFDPASWHDGETPAMVRPHFLAIISSNTMAQVMCKRATGRVDGFVVEGPSAGGHNAPPRGAKRLPRTGAPVYGTRDLPDLEELIELGRPFWLAGSYGFPGGLQKALRNGAAGVQVGTAFAYCEESGITPDIKAEVLERSCRGEVCVETDARASPAGFPFKVVRLPGTVSEEPVYAARPRVCDLGFLRQAYARDDGTLGWRCAAEPRDDFVRKGGDPEETHGRKCVCNGLMATVGCGQWRNDGYREPALVTSGSDVGNVAAFLPDGASSYTAADVIERILA